MIRRISITLGGFVALFLFAQSLAGAAISTTQLTNDPGNQGRPDVNGSTVVWKDNRNGNWDIYMENLVNRTEAPVSTDPAYQNLPVTNGFIVVWQDNRNGDNDIYMKNLLTGVTEPLVSAPGNQMLPAISGTKVVYVDNQVDASPTDTSPNNNIYEIDLSTRVITPVCTAAASQWQPRISGDKVVWQDNRNGKWDLYMKDLSTGVETPVCTDAGNHEVPDIDGNRVVWQDYRNGQYDIWMKDLSTGVEQPVTNDAAFQNSPRISGDLIVWENYDYSNTADDYDIYMKNLTTGVISGLASGPSTQARPAVNGETVVWEQTGANGYDIWMAHVPDVTPPAVSNETPADGSVTDCASPVIQAAFSDNRTGIDTGSVRLLLDGNDVTAGSSVSDTGISYAANSLASGPHTASLSVSDGAGNAANVTWQFTVSPPVLKLAGAHSYWASYSDYTNRVLSVAYSLSNPATGAAVGTQIIASTATSGVLFITPAPVPVGDIAPGAQSQAVVQYLIPPGVNNFKTSVYVSDSDTCGGAYYFPGPPPGV